MHDTDYTDCMQRINHRTKRCTLWGLIKSFCKVQDGLVPLNLPVKLSAARVLRFFFRCVTGSVMVIGWLLSIPNPKIKKNNNNKKHQMLHHRFLGILSEFSFLKWLDETECFVTSSYTCVAVGGMRDQTTALHLARCQSATGYLRERERNLHSKKCCVIRTQQQCSFTSRGI